MSTFRTGRPKMCIRSTRPWPKGIPIYPLEPIPRGHTDWDIMPIADVYRPPPSGFETSPINEGPPLQIHARVSPEQSTCDICFTKNLDHSRTCVGCHGIACHTCVENWLRVRITGGFSTFLTCLRCPRLFTAEEVKLFCPGLYKRYSFFLSREEEKDNPLAAWCPNQSCYRLLADVRRELSPMDKVVECPDCSKLLCAKCFSFSHEGEQCNGPNLGFRQKVLAGLWQQLHTKKCPMCSVRIQRSGGCNQMRCTSCSNKFCWKCRGILPGHPGNVEEDHRIHECRCTRAGQIMTKVAVAGGIVIAIPLALAIALVVGPPVGLILVVAPKEKRKAAKAELRGLFSMSPDHDDNNHDYGIDM